MKLGDEHIVEDCYVILDIFMCLKIFIKQKKRENKRPPLLHQIFPVLYSLSFYFLSICLLWLSTLRLWKAEGTLS